MHLLPMLKFYPANKAGRSVHGVEGRSTVFGAARINGYVVQAKMKYGHHLDCCTGAGLSAPAVDVFPEASLSKTSAWDSDDEVNFKKAARVSARKLPDLSLWYENSDYSDIIEVAKLSLIAFLDSTMTGVVGLRSVISLDRVKGPICALTDVLKKYEKRQVVMPVLAVGRGPSDITEYEERPGRPDPYEWSPRDPHASPTHYGQLNINAVVTPLASIRRGDPARLASVCFYAKDEQRARGDETIIDSYPKFHWRDVATLAPKESWGHR